MLNFLRKERGEARKPKTKGGKERKNWKGLGKEMKEEMKELNFRRL